MKMPCSLDRLLDTYIQQARMFGSRKRHLAHFELTIPEQLYLDWHRCFVFHKLALEAIKTKKGSPVWLADQRIPALLLKHDTQATELAHLIHANYVTRV
jgi:hypothetical protein